MLLNDRELTHLENLISDLSPFSSLASLFISDKESALEKINEARRKIDEVPSSLRSKIKRALDVLEEQVSNFYDSLAEKRGVVYDALMSYVTAPLNQGVEWFKPLISNPDEFLKMLPLRLYGSGVGAKKLRAALAPTPVELEVFLTSIDPNNPSFEAILKNDEYEIRTFLESIIGKLARDTTVIEENRVIVYYNRVVNVTPEEAAKIAYHIEDYSALYVIKYPWYKRLADDLSRALGEETYLFVSTENPSVTITVRIDKALKNAGIDGAGALDIVFKSTGLYPETIERISLRLNKLEGREIENSATIAHNIPIKMPPEKQYEFIVDLLSREITESCEIAKRISRDVAMFEKAGYSISKVSFFDSAILSEPRRYNIYMNKTSEIGKEYITAHIFLSGKLNIVEVSIDSNKYKVLKNVIDPSEWRSMVENHVNDLFEIKWFHVYSNSVTVHATTHRTDRDTVEMINALYSAIHESFNEYLEKKRRLKESFRVGTQEAIALLIAYYAFPDIKKRFEEQTSHSFSEVFMKVGALLTKKGKPIPGAYSISDKPGLAVSRLLETGDIAIDENGKIYVEGKPLTEILSWMSDAPSIEQEAIKSMLSDTSTMLKLMSKSPQFIKKMLIKSHEMSDMVVNILIKDGENIPKDTRLDLLKSLSPTSIVRILDEAPKWLTEDQEAVATVLYLAGRARASPKLTAFTFNHYPGVLGSDVHTVTIGTVDFIDKGDYVALFAGLNEPSTNAKRVFEVYDRRLRRGIVVAAFNVDEAVSIASKEMSKAISEYRSIASELDMYESQYNIQVEMQSKNTEGFMLPEFALRFFEPSGTDRTFILPLQPRMRQVFEETIRKHASSARLEKEEEKAVST